MSLPEINKASSPRRTSPPSTPEPPFRHTNRRPARAPLDMLAVAAARTLGCGNRISLLLAAAGSGASMEIQRLSRQAVASLLLVHKERLLQAINLARLETGRPPV